MTTPSQLRRVNQRRAVAALTRLGGRASRAELAKATGMSQVTAGKVADDLIAAGVLEVAPADVPPAVPAAATGLRSAGAVRLGRPGQGLRLESSTPRFLAIELGVTATRLAALPVGVSAEDRWDEELPTGDDPRDWSGRVGRSARSLFPASLPEAVLMSVPGVVDEAAGRALLTPNLHWAERADLPRLARPRGWQCPVILVQEIRALALGQRWADPAGGDFLLADFGDGVGAAAVVRGELFDGSAPLSGELGHTPVPGNERRCGCGAVGCVETLVSRRGLLAGFAEHAAGRPTWAALADAVAARGVEPWLARGLDAAAAVIVGALNVLGLRRAVITGLLADLPPAAMAHLAGRVRAGALWSRFGEVTCAAAPRRRSAGLVAAALDRVLLPPPATLRPAAP